MGDILFFNNRAFISLVIRFLDGSDYNHAAFVHDSDHVAESLASEGVGLTDLPSRMRDAEFVRIMRLRAAPQDYTPVVQASDVYLDAHERYAYEDILLLVALLLVRRSHLPRVLKIPLRIVLDSAASLIAEIFAHGKHPLICSAFVFRSYNDSGLALYRIRVRTAAAVGFVASLRSTRYSLAVAPDSLLGAVANAHRAQPLWLEGTTQRLPDLALISASNRREEVERALGESLAGIDLDDPDGDMISVQELAADPEIQVRVERLATVLLRASAGAPSTPSVRPLQAELLTTALSILPDAFGEFVTPAELASSPDLHSFGTYTPHDA